MYSVSAISVTTAKRGMMFENSLLLFLNTFLCIQCTIFKIKIRVKK